MEPKLTAVIITYNEQENIGRCLNSLHGVVDDVVVVDSFSSDDTVSICEREGVRVVQREWQGYSAAKNYANELTRSDYILSVDADEVLSPELKDSILRLKKAGFDNKAYSVKRLNHYCGKWIRWGEWYPDRKIRLFSKAIAHWDGPVHERLVHTHTQVELLDGELLHFSYRSIRQHVDKSLVYSKLMAAQDIAHKKRRFLVYHGLLKPYYYFIKSFFLKLGFLDGSRGFVIAVIISWERFLRYFYFHEARWSPRKGHSP